MRVILKKGVSNLGEAGEIVKVSPGYGRNYLIPRGLAIAASEGSVREAEHQQRMADAIRRKQMNEAQELAAKLENVSVSIRRAAGEDDKLFGSVTNRDIAEALEAEGVELDRRLIKLDENIRAIGLYNVPVRLHKDVSADVRVYVIRE
jgi:large subunit ribosomal protein L9